MDTGNGHQSPRGQEAPPGPKGQAGQRFRGVGLGRLELPTSRLSGVRHTSVGFDTLRISRFFGLPASIRFDWIRWDSAPFLAPLAGMGCGPGIEGPAGARLLPGNGDCPTGVGHIVWMKSDILSAFVQGQEGVACPAASSKRSWSW